MHPTLDAWAWHHITQCMSEGWLNCLRIEIKSLGINAVKLEPEIIAIESDDLKPCTGWYFGS